MNKKKKLQWLIKYTMQVVGVTSDKASDILDCIEGAGTWTLVKYPLSILLSMLHMLSYAKGTIAAGHCLSAVAKQHGVASIEPLLKVLLYNLDPSFYKVFQKHGTWYICEYQRCLERARLLAATTLEDVLRWLIREGKGWSILTDEEKGLVGHAITSVSLNLEWHNIVNEWREDHRRNCPPLTNDLGYIKITEDALRSIAELGTRIIGM